MTPGRRRALAGLALGACLALFGCDRLPGRPLAADRDVRPTEVLAFDVLYPRNCAGCHGADGRLGASRPLDDPLYLALVPRDRLREVIGRGIPGTAQPAFAASAGGALTDAQVDALVDGLIRTWGRPDASRGLTLPPYSAAAAREAGSAPGDPGRGKAVYDLACASCHGAGGGGGPRGGAVTDPSYLALVSDQYLRTTVIAGRPDLGMPDWRGYVANQPLSPQAVSDVVAWLVAARRPVPGRPGSDPAPRSGRH
ncbi:MAG: c-type cytochrome [Candidatus Rokubacteria bacterium]|nr:c-type cytochrome [Candidatus Rokubacteria bacterium]